MKLRFSILAALCAALLTAAPSALADNARVYYVALGDSVAGIENGYPQQLTATLRHDTPKLELVNLSCGGESTASMITGYPATPPPIPATQHYGPACQTYPHGSQLDQAVAYLNAHRPFVRLITIDIGAADLPGFDVEKGLVQIRRNLPVILAALRAAAGPNVPIVGMNYYSPYLVAWFDDPAFAHTLVDLTVQFNNGLEAIYQAAGSPVADVETAFSLTDFTIQPDGLPLNVERVCQWTLMCTAGDVHPNEEGSAVIAHAFGAVLP
jgi:lysophospholipase L1-like esterase